MASSLAVPKVLGMDAVRWWVAHRTRIAEQKAAIRDVEGAVNDMILLHGPQRVDGVLVDLKVMKWEYDPAIGREFPALATHVVTIACSALEQAERVMSLVDEQLEAAIKTGDVALDYTAKVDGRKALSVIAKGGEAATRINALRTPGYRKIEVGG